MTAMKSFLKTLFSVVLVLSPVAAGSQEPPPAAPLRLVAVENPGTLFAEPDASVDVAARTWREGGGLLVFATHRPFVHEAHPVLLFGGRVWQFDGDPFQQMGWVYVGVSRDRAEIFAVLDGVIEAPMPELVVLRSQDGGTTWSRGGAVAKPHYFAQLHEVVLRRGGVGSVTVLLDEDYGSSHEPGYYRYNTTDGGASWSEPERQSHHADEIDEVRDDGSAAPIKSVEELSEWWGNPRS